MDKRFLNALGPAQDAEKEIATWLESKGHIIISFNNDRRWDIFAEYKGKKAKYEVKRDNWEFYNHPTGNIVIEFSDRGKPSGIETSQSNFYVYYYQMKGEIWITPTHKLKEYIKKRKEDHMKGLKSLDAVSMGDDNLARGWLLKCQDLKDIFKIYYKKSTIEKK